MSVLRIDAITIQPILLGDFHEREFGCSACLSFDKTLDLIGPGLFKQEASNNMLESSIIRLLFIFLFSKTLYSYVEIVRLKEIIVCLLAVEAGKSVLGSNYCL